MSRSGLAWPGGVRSGDLAGLAALASPAFTGTLGLPTYTIATRPAASVGAGKAIWVSDAPAGSRVQTSDGTTWTSPGAARTFRTTHTFAIKGALAAADSTPGFFVSLASGQSVNIVKARYVIASGTNVTFKIQKNGADLTGYGTTGAPLTATPAAAETVSTQALADNDFLDLVIVGVSAAPTDITVTVVLEHTA